MSKTAMVLGAGMAGVSTALHLQQRGWSVILVDRNLPGRETSFGNAGIIQSEAVEPHPMPRALPILFAIALGRTNDVQYEFRALFGQARALLGYWWHSEPGRHGRISESYGRLIRHAAEEHQQFIGPAGVEHLIRRDGFRIFHRTEAGLARELAKAERIRSRFGVSWSLLSPAELAAAEPVLTPTGAGAVHYLKPWSVRDPGGLVSAYCDLFLRRGGSFVQAAADDLGPKAGGGWRIGTRQGFLEAEHAVVALGPWSSSAVARFGYRIPMVRKRGYHLHYRAPVPLSMPLMDAAYGYVLAPMERGMRITTGAHLAISDGPSRQVEKAEEMARTLFDLGERIEQIPWMGVRPCMPDMLPVIGRAPNHPGLWMHFGHGHQGFTLGPASGRLLAEMMSGEAPYVDPLPYRPERL